MFSCTEFHDIDEVYRYLQGGGAVDILFLDVPLNGGCSLQSMGLLRGMGYNMHLVFMSDSNDYAVTGYRIWAAIHATPCRRASSMTAGKSSGENCRVTMVLFTVFT